MPVVHWLHTDEYATFQTTLGRQVERWTIHSPQGEMVGYLVLLMFPLHRGSRFAYAPYGPVLWIPLDEELTKAIKAFLYTYAQEERLAWVRVQGDEERLGGKLGLSPPLWTYRGSFAQPRAEAILALDKKREDVWAGFSRTTKRNLRKALSQALELTWYQEREIRESLDDFVALNQANISQHGTTTHERAYFEKLLTQVSENPHNRMVVVRQGSEIVAMNLVTVFGRQAFCPYGASSQRGKDLGAYYLIKWEIIQDCLSRELEEFNWGGIATGEHDQHLLGLNQFKLGFGTTPRTYPPYQDIVLSRVLYALYLGYKYLGSRS